MTRYFFISVLSLFFLLQAAADGDTENIKDLSELRLPSVVEKEWVLIGFFVDDAGRQYAMVVNNLHGKGRSSRETADTIELTFGDDVEDVEAVSWLDGEEGKLAMNNKTVSLQIAGGTGGLIKAR